MNTTYTIETLSDLLKVPIDRREDCLRDLEYALALHELAHGEQAQAAPLGAIHWTDDGNHTVKMVDADGQWLVLQVTEETNCDGLSPPSA